MDDDFFVFTNPNDFYKLQQFLGKRPGDYNLDPYYVRRGMGNKPYFWDAINKKWRDVRLGDKFYFDDYGIAVQEKVSERAS